MKKITLSNGMICLVDDEDFDYLKPFNWHAMRSGNNYYAQRHWFNDKTGKKSHKRMHREILKVKDGKISVDHIDRNGLNNQKSNLRLCTCSENHRNCRMRGINTIGYRGVSQWNGAKIWKDYNGPIFRSRINHAGKEIHIGFFRTAKEAALARDVKTTELHGKFGVLNFPEITNAI